MITKKKNILIFTGLILVIICFGITIYAIAENFYKVPPAYGTFVFKEMDVN